MKNSSVGVPQLEVSNLETRPLTPIIMEDDIHHNVNTIEKAPETSEHVPPQRQGSMMKIFSPASADVMARKDSARAKISSQRMTSKRTLKFQSPIDIANNKVETPIAEPRLDDNRLSVPRKIRKTASDRRSSSVLVRSRLGEGGVTSASEDERGSGQSNVTVISQNKLAR